MASVNSTTLNHNVSEIYYSLLTQRFQFDNTPLLAAAGACFAVGYLQYFYAMKLIWSHGRTPMPFWMHLFYLAHDSLFSYTMGSAAGRYNNHFYLRGCSIAYAIWSCLEVYCIYYSVRYNREQEFSSAIGNRSKSLGATLRYVVFMQAAMYAVVYLVAELLGGPGCILHWGLLTNVVMIIGPTHEMLRRGSIDGLAVGFCIVNVFCAIFTFAPFGMWVRAMPEVFDTPSFYWVGSVLFGYTLWLLNIVASYPPSPSTVSINGKTVKAH